jgi:hypothetical protein
VSIASRLDLCINPWDSISSSRIRPPPSSYPQRLYCMFSSLPRATSDPSKFHCASLVNWLASRRVCSHGLSSSLRCHGNRAKPFRLLPPHPAKRVTTSLLPRGLDCRHRRQGSPIGTDCQHNLWLPFSRKPQQLSQHSTNVHPPARTHPISDHIFRPRLR